MIRGFFVGVPLILLAAGIDLVVRGFRDPIGANPPEGFEALRSRAAYQTSRTCAPCHPDHAKSFGRTFHRTMTQKATPGSVLGKFDGVPFEVLGVRSTPSREGDRFFLETTHPKTGELTRFEIVRTVGSRRMQQYVMKEGDRHLRLPIAWSIDQQRWFHLSEAFFHPDGEPFHQNTAVWDLNCIFCHNVKPNPRLAVDGSMASEVAELGIACEACHGPGEEHERRMRSPGRRYAFHLTAPVDPTIVNPARIEKMRSVQVCGHCHGQRLPADRDQIMEIYKKGDPYTPGENLARFFVPVDRETRVGDFRFAPRFWSDGSPRLTAYEYQGLLRSRCFQKGEMTCVSCHSMHSGDPHGQLRPDLPGNRMCTQCHGAFTGGGLAAHTKHLPKSTGSTCVSCHMPEEVYGIMSWHPTHEIRSPDPARSAAAEKPDACTACHTGRSRKWAAAKSVELWPRLREGGGGTVRGALFDAPEIPRALFSGDVVYRTLAAVRLGEPAVDPGVAGWAVPLLAEALVDPYPSVRRAARDSLGRLTGRRDLPFALDPVRARQQARADLTARAVGPAPPAGSGWPIDSRGMVDERILTKWIHEREEVPVSIGE